MEKDKRIVARHGMGKRIMIDEKHKSSVLIGLIILILLFAILETSLLKIDTTKPIQKNPVSQTRASDEYNSFNFTVENEGTEIRGIINNKTEVEVWSANGTKLTYRGTLENYSKATLTKATLRLYINKSAVDIVAVVQHDLSGL